MNPLALFLLGGGAYALYKLQQTKKAGDEISISIGSLAVTKIQKAALNGWAEIYYDNFTSLPLNIHQPTGKVFLQDKTTEIGHVIPEDLSTDVPKYGRNSIPCTIHFTIPLSNILFAAPALLAGNKANVKIIVRVETVFNGIPYSTEKEYTI